jgi:hypothetical protein
MRGMEARERMANEAATARPARGGFMAKGWVENGADDAVGTASRPSPARIGAGRQGSWPHPGRHRPSWKRGARWLAAAAAAMALAACTPAGFPPACPQLSLISGASDLIRLSGTGPRQDIRNLVLAARIEAVPANCKFAGAHGVGAEMRVQFTVQRGPAATGRDVELHYFVAATRGDTILDEQDYVVKGSFAPNVDRMTLIGDPIDLVFPVGADQSAAGYHIYVGFRLTKQELDNNRAQGL